MRSYGAQGLRHLVVQTYEGCRVALEELGLRPSPALDEVYGAALRAPSPPRTTELASLAAGTALSVPGTREERRVVSLLFAEVVTATDAVIEDPEDLRDLVGDALANVITALRAWAAP